MPTTEESILLEVDVANTSVSDITVDVKVNKNSGGTGGTDDIFIVKAAPVPVGGALKVVSGQKIVMMSTATASRYSNGSGQCGQFRRLYRISFRGRIING